ncbi:MAG: tetratricopeptide repeat protein [Nitrospiraceae bacterium]|nr:MAG: tetratricopeptide repeat protein [Nitrospiraceae bacterium]
MGRTLKRFKISITALLFLFMLANLIFAFFWQGRFWISPLDHYHKARELETKGNLEGALKEAEQAVRKKPHNTEYRNYLGWTHFRLEQFDDAVREFRKSLEIDQYNFEAIKGIYEAQEKGSGKTYLRDYVNDNPDPDVLLLLANISSLDAGTYDLAIDAYQQYLKARPSDSETRLNLIRLLESEKRFKEAETEYEILLQNDPENREYALKLARLKSWNGQFNTSISIYNKLLPDPPHDVKLLEEKASVQQWAKDFSGAVETWELILSLDNKNVNAMKNLARMYSYMKDAELKEIQIRHEIARIAPRDTGNRLRLAELLTARSLYEEAISQHEEIRKRGTMTPDSMKQLAQLYQWNGDHVSAAETYEALYRIEAKCNYLISAAGNYEITENYKGASRAYDMCLEKEPDNLAVRESLARVYTYSPDTLSQAAGEYETLLSHSDIVGTRKTLAGIYIQLGNHRRAITHLEVLVEREPTKENRLELARTLSWEKNYERSIQFYNNLIQQYPADRELLLEKAKVLTWDKKYNDAITVYDQLLRDDPDNPALLADRDLVYQWAEGQRRPVEISEARPDRISEEKVSDRGRIYELTGRGEYEEALVYYDKLIAENPDDSSLIREKAEILSMLGRHEESYQIYKKMYGDSDDPEHVMLLAQHAAYADQYKEAAVYLERVRAQDPSHVEAGTLLAEVRAWDGQYSESMQLYRELFRSGHDSPRIMQGYAQVSGWDDRHRSSYFLYEDMLKKDPDNVDVMVKAAREAMAFGYHARADHLLKKSLLIDPDNSLAQESRNMLMQRMSPSVQAGFSAFSDSENFKKYSSELSGAKPFTRFVLEAGASLEFVYGNSSDHTVSGNDPGDRKDFNRQSGHIGINKYFVMPLLSVGASASIHRYSFDETNFAYDIHAEYSHSDVTRMNFGVRRFDLIDHYSPYEPRTYNIVQDIRGVIDENIQMTYVDVELNRHLNKKHNVLLAGGAGWVTDDNNYWDVYGQYEYRIIDLPDRQLALKPHAYFRNYSMVSTVEETGFFYVPYYNPESYFAGGFTVNFREDVSRKFSVELENITQFVYHDGEDSVSFNRSIYESGNGIVEQLLAGIDYRFSYSFATRFYAFGLYETIDNYKLIHGGFSLLKRF